MLFKNKGIFYLAREYWICITPNMVKKLCRLVLQEQMDLLNFGNAMLFPAMGQILINIFSGFLLITLILVIGQDFSFGLNQKPLQPILFGFLPLLAVILNILFSFGIQVFTISQLFLAIWIWSSPVPAIWLGISLGWLFARQTPD